MLLHRTNEDNEKFQVPVACFDSRAFNFYAFFHHSCYDEASSTYTRKELWVKNLWIFFFAFPFLSSTHGNARKNESRRKENILINMILWWYPEDVLLLFSLSFFFMSSHTQRAFGPNVIKTEILHNQYTCNSSFPFKKTSRLAFSSSPFHQHAH